MKKIILSCIFLFTICMGGQVFAASPTVAISLGSYALSSGQTTSVTFTFSDAPRSFTLGDIAATGGVVTNLVNTGNPLVYTALYTPNTNTQSTGNTITVHALTTNTTITGVGSGPSEMAFDGTNMWVADTYDNAVSKIAPDGTITKYTGTGGSPYAIAFDGTNMWTADYDTDSVTKISPSGVMHTYFGTGHHPNSIAFDGTNMWTADFGNNSVTKVTPSGTMTTYTGTGLHPHGIAFDGTNMWTADYDDDSFTMIAPDGTIATSWANAGSNPFAIAYDGSRMWVTDFGSNTVSNINTTTHSTNTYAGTGAGPYGISFDGTSMWLANFDGGSITKVNTDGTMTTYTGMGDFPYSTRSDGHSIWVTNIFSSTIHKLGFLAETNSNSFSVNTIRHSGAYNSVRATSIDTKPLDFILNKGVLETKDPSVSLALNADPATVSGYAISLDAHFAGGIIHPYGKSTDTYTYELPHTPGTYTVYLKYFSKTGNSSEVIQHTISYNKKIKIPKKVIIKKIKK